MYLELCSAKGAGTEKKAEGVHAGQLWWFKVIFLSCVSKSTRHSVKFASFPLEMLSTEQSYLHPQFLKDVFKAHGYLAQPLWSLLFLPLDF